MIDRPTDQAAILDLMAAFPVTGILGPRQSGKTTLAREIAADHVFDLENPRDAAMLAEPQLALEALSGLIVIDEIQRKPDLFPLLRYLVDTHRDQRYLILGSACTGAVAACAARRTSPAASPAGCRSAASAGSWVVNGKFG